MTCPVLGPNTSTVEPLTITSPPDNIYRNLATRGTCTTAAGTVLPVSPGPGNTYTCAFSAPSPATAAASQTDIVTAAGTDADGTTATAFDDATVTLVNVLPPSAVDKDASPLTRPEPGGTFTFTVMVTNTQRRSGHHHQPHRQHLRRPRHPGRLHLRCPHRRPLARRRHLGACSFTGDFFGNAGATQTDVVTATAVDDDGHHGHGHRRRHRRHHRRAAHRAGGQDGQPHSRPAPGGTFTFSVVVNNTGIEPSPSRALVDDIYGNLATTARLHLWRLIGTVLAPGASPPCTFPGNFTGVAGTTQTDIVTVTATDDEGNTATDTDDATVTITAAPSIRVDKTADPSTLPEPGGTFTFRSWSPTPAPSRSPSPPSPTTSTATSPPGAGSTCGALIGTVLAPAATSAPCTFPGTFTGPAGASQTDIVTVTGQSPAGTDRHRHRRRHRAPHQRGPGHRGGQDGQPPHPARPRRQLHLHRGGHQHQHHRADHHHRPHRQHLRQHRPPGPAPPAAPSSAPPWLPVRSSPLLLHR